MLQMPGTIVLNAVDISMVALTPDFFLPWVSFHYKMPANGHVGDVKSFLLYFLNFCYSGLAIFWCKMSSGGSTSRIEPETPSGTL
jgi:hypothetical protein